MFIHKYFILTCTFLTVNSLTIHYLCLFFSKFPWEKSLWTFKYGPDTELINFRQNDSQSSELINQFGIRKGIRLSKKCDSKHIII